MKKHKAAFYFLIFVLLLSCSSGSRESDYAYMEAEAPSAIMKSEALLEISDEVLSDSVSSSLTISEETDRKRIYNGSIGLVVDKTEDSRKELETLTVSTGGYVESSYSDYMVLRIPAPSFRSTFDTILTMGKVSYQEITTWDVTEQFADTQQRLSTALRTRERLYILLEQSSDAEERAAILREIGRLSEEIESIKQQLSMMENRIAFSRITVALESRLAMGENRFDIPFEWIATLDPLYPASDHLKGRAVINPGNDFAVFEKEDNFIAEDAEGTTLFISTVKNDPRGDALFWQKALQFHLSEYYESAEKITVQVGQKEFKGIHFISKDRQPFQYMVTVHAEGKSLHILELFSPLAHQDLSTVIKNLKEGEIK